MGAVNEIFLQRPHAKQYEILNNRKRFNYLRCGRRFGKTSLISFLVAEKIQGYNGIFAPTYKDLNEIWVEVKHRFEPIIQSKNEQLKQIVFKTGGKIDFWSLEDPNSGRGRKYHRIIIDEAEKVGKLMESYKMNLRYTLVDFGGDLYMFTTPKGSRTEFDTLWNKAKDSNDSATFQYSTADNPHLPKHEIEAILRDHDEVSLQQEFYGNVVDWAASNRFYYSYRRDKHVSTEPLLLNNNMPIWVYCDFNVNPMVWLIAQIDSYKKWVRVIKEYSIPNSGTHNLSRMVFSDYPNLLKYVDGDRTGWGRKTSSEGLKSDYEIIMREMRINWAQIKAPKTNNPEHQFTRSVGNNAFEKYDILIDASCTTLINDLETAQANEKGQLVKNGNTENGRHAIDNLRYLFNTHYGTK